MLSLVLWNILDRGVGSFYDVSIEGRGQQPGSNREERNRTMSARDKDARICLNLKSRGIDLPESQARILRRAALTLQRWG